MPEKGGKFNASGVHPKIHRAVLPDEDKDSFRALVMAYDDVNYGADEMDLD
jgi:hypothetical protein